MLMVVLLMLEMLMLVMLMLKPELVMPNTNDNYAITNAGNAMLMLVQ